MAVARCSICKKDVETVRVTPEIVKAKLWHGSEEFEQHRRKGISVTSIAVNDSDIATIEKGDSVISEYTEGFRIIMLSAARMKQLEREKKGKSSFVTYPNPSTDDIERVRKILRETEKN